jgi:hypothetical protein
MTAIDLAPIVPPPPRIVKRRISGGCGLAIMRLFILPHTVAGLFLLLSVPAHLYVHLFGTPVVAVVDRSEISASKKGHRSYEIYFHYTVDGHRFHDQTSAGIDEPQRAVAGFTFDGLASQFAEHAMFIPHDKSLVGDVLPLLLAALLWNGILSLFLYAVWINPIRQRWLFKYGQAATGAVTGHREIRGKGTRHVVEYEFTTLNGSRVKGKGDVPKRTYDQIADGSPVAVLYIARRPGWNQLYAHGDFLVKSAKAPRAYNRKAQQGPGTMRSS